MPVITEAPVVVSPEKDSNTASVMESAASPVSISGREPNSASTLQNSAAIRKPSRVRSSLRARRLGRNIARPVRTVMPMAAVKACHWPSPNSSEIRIGGIMVRLNSISSSPRMRRIMRRLIERCSPSLCGPIVRLEEGEADLEQPLHLADATLVDHEEDDVVAGRHHHIVVGDQHLLAAHHGANGGAPREVDLADGTSHHQIGRASCRE